jgi:hypothetical protein
VLVSMAKKQEETGGPGKEQGSPGFEGPAPKRRDERTMALCEGMIDIAAALYSVPSRELRRSGRSPLGVARVRQIAMYTAHTTLRVSMREVGRAFGRDRSTVAHACRMVEELRDDKEFDKLLSITERVALAAFGERVGT